MLISVPLAAQLTIAFFKIEFITNMRSGKTVINISVKDGSCMARLHKPQLNLYTVTTFNWVSG